MMLKTSTANPTNTHINIKFSGNLFIFFLHTYGHSIRNKKPKENEQK